MARKLVTALIYPGFVAVDITGPTDAFAFATKELETLGRGKDGYDIRYVSDRSGAVKTLSGGAFHAECGLDEIDQPIDILVVPGAETGDFRYRDLALIELLKRRFPYITRICSVCSGALLLGETGVLNGRRVTTHWQNANDLARLYPQVTVEADKIFLRDGPIYSSGGVTAGIDLALSIIEEDYGRALALKVAKRMIVFLKRPGDQSQFSDLLQAQAKVGALDRTIDWIEANLGEQLTVQDLAETAAMSARNFSRVFTRELGLSHMQYVERRRLEAARHMLEAQRHSLDQIAESTGLGTRASFARAFRRAFSVSPSQYRERFSTRDT